MTKLTEQSNIADIDGDFCVISASGLAHGVHVGRQRQAAGDVDQPEAAEGLGLGDAEKACLAHFSEDVVGGEGRVLLPLVDVRVDFLVDKVTDRATQFFVFLGKYHFYSPKDYRRATPKVLELSGRTAASARRSVMKIRRERVSPSGHALTAIGG